MMMMMILMMMMSDNNDVWWWHGELRCIGTMIGTCLHSLSFNYLDCNSTQLHKLNYLIYSRRHVFKHTCIWDICFHKTSAKYSENELPAKQHQILFYLALDLYLWLLHRWMPMSWKSGCRIVHSSIRKISGWYRVLLKSFLLSDSCWWWTRYL